MLAHMRVMIHHRQEGLMSIVSKIGFVVLFALSGMNSALGQSSWSAFDVDRINAPSCCFTQIPAGQAGPTDGVQFLRIGPSGNGTPFTIPLGAFANRLDIQTANARIDQGFQQIQHLQSELTQAGRGIAAVAAMANISMPSAPGRTTWALNGAVFQSEYGGGLSLAHRLNFSVPVAITAAYGNGGGSAHVGRIGLMGEF